MDMRYVESGMSRLLQSDYNSPDRTVFPVYEEIRPIPGPAMGNNETRLLLFPSGRRNGPIANPRRPGIQK